MVALTFDDGPSHHTDRILDTLYRHNSQATFFVLGNRVSGNSITLRKAVSQGNEIAGHSWDHKLMTRQSESQIRHELQSTNDAIENVLGIRPMMFRPPFGAYNNRVRRVAQDEGFAIINWSLDPQDWRSRNANAVYNAIMNNVTDGSIILLHDIHASTATAMEMVIPELIRRGYTLVTVSELLGELEPGVVYTR